MIIKNFPLSVLILVMLVAACAQQPSTDPVASEPGVGAEAQTLNASEPGELIVFAAASLTGAFGEIGEVFETVHPGVTLIFNFAGSQQLAQQINEGAPADVFASANMVQMEVVVEAGGIDDGAQQTFAQNRLVVIFPQDNPALLKALIDLANPGLKLVFAAQEVPVGQYSMDFLDKATADPAFGASFKEDVVKNIVSYEETVKAVLTKVVLGEADAGIVYTSDLSGEDAEQVRQLEIPDALNVIASYPIAPVKESEHPELAQAFIDLVISPEGQSILSRYNFIPVK